MAGIRATSAFADDRVPEPRVKPEARSIYKQHQGTIQNIMLEVEGKSFLTSPSKSTYKKPKDHMLANVKRMRQIQKACRERVNESETKEPEPVKALWRSTKYSDVPSKVAQFLAINFEARRPASARPAEKAAGAEEKAKGASENNNVESKSNVNVRRPHSARASIGNRPEIVPPLGNIEDENVVNGKKMPRSFIRINALAASHMPVRRAPSVASLQETKQRLEEDFKRYHRGEVPDYIVERKKQWQSAEEERIRNLPDPEQPPGHRRLPEEERRATLEKLQQRERDLTSELLRLPLRVDTPRMIRHKNDIEVQLSQVDEAIKVFSRNKVFVKCD